MSRIGKKPVDIPSGVKADLKDSVITLNGPKGTLTWSLPKGVQVKVDDGAKAITVTRDSDQAHHRALHGMTRALINNMAIGVSQGYEQKMEIYGTGYGCTLSGNRLDLNVGYSHTVTLTVPEGVKVDIEVPNAKGDETPAVLKVSGIDKQKVGQFARDIKDTRHPEPYKGKGVRYAGEQIRRKAGKAFAGAGG